MPACSSPAPPKGANPFGTSGTLAHCHAVGVPKFWHARHAGTVPRGRCPKCRRAVPNVPEFWHTAPRPRASLPGVPEFWHASPAAACQRAGRARILARLPAACASVPGVPGTCPRPRASVPSVPAFWHTSPRPRASVPFDAAFKHRAALAETAYKKLRLVWNSSVSYREKLKIFQSVFIGTLIYGLDALTLQDKHLKRIDAYYIRFLRRIVGVKASYYSRITNLEVCRRAGEPRKPSDTLHKLQIKMLDQVYSSPIEDPLHSVVFCSAYKDRIQVTGRRRGGKIPYWLEITTQRHFPQEWHANPGVGFLGPNLVYAEIGRSLRRRRVAPMRAES